VNMRGSPASAVPLSALIFNAIIIPLLIPRAIRRVRYRPSSAGSLLIRNIMIYIYGIGGVIVPFVCRRSISSRQADCLSFALCSLPTTVLLLAPSFQLMP